MGAYQYFRTLFSTRVGYFGEQASKNLGDVAVYAALRHHKIGAALYDLVKHPNYPLRFKLRVRNSTCILVGGGTVISSGNERNFRYMTEHSPTWTFGTGAGSCGFSEPPNTNLAPLADALKRVKRLTVRGPVSQAALKQIGVEGAEVIGDPALSLVDRIAGIRNSRTGKRCCINLVRPFERTEREQFQKLHAELMTLVTRLQKKGWSFEFAALEPR